MYSHFLHGAASGFAVSTIISPRIISCIRRSIVKGFFAGIFTGFGAALADATYASIAAFGMFGISGFLIKNATIWAVLCGLYLINVGVETFFRKPEHSKRILKKIDFLNIAVSTFFVTISNPVYILSFVVIFTGFNIGPNSFTTGTSLIFGVLVGSLIWWVILSFFGALLKNKLTSNKVVLWVNRVSSIVIVIFGISMIFKVIIRAIFK